MTLTPSGSGAFDILHGIPTRVPSIWGNMQKKPGGRGDRRALKLSMGRLSEVVVKLVVVVGLVVVIPLAIFLDYPRVLIEQEFVFVQFGLERR